MRQQVTLKIEDEAYNLIKEMTLNNYQWSNERGQAKWVGGKFDVDGLTLLTTKMDAMTQKLDWLDVNAVNSFAPSPTRDRCGFHDHVTEKCQEMEPFCPFP